MSIEERLIYRLFLILYKYKEGKGFPIVLEKVVEPTSCLLVFYLLGCREGIEEEPYGFPKGRCVPFD